MEGPAGQVLLQVGEVLEFGCVCGGGWVGVNVCIGVCVCMCVCVCVDVCVCECVDGWLWMCV